MQAVWYPSLLMSQGERVMEKVRGGGLNSPEPTSRLQVSREKEEKVR